MHSKTKKHKRGTAAAMLVCAVLCLCVVLGSMGTRVSAAMELDAARAEPPAYAQENEARAAAEQSPAAAGEQRAALLPLLALITVGSVFLTLLLSGLVFYLQQRAAAEDTAPPAVYTAGSAEWYDSALLCGRQGRQE